jgi:hypothetical protein
VRVWPIARYSPMGVLNLASIGLPSGIERMVGGWSVTCVAGECQRILQDVGCWAPAACCPLLNFANSLHVRFGCLSSRAMFSAPVVWGPIAPKVLIVYPVQMAMLGVDNCGPRRIATPMGCP